jgi:ATP-dependent HslUV protease subunit HslV
MNSSSINNNNILINSIHIVAGFAGSTADAMALFERLESQLDQHNGQLVRASVELAKLWRSDKFMRHLDATLIVANAEITLQLTGSGDVVEAHDGVTAVGSGSPIALGAARALIDMPLTAEEIAIKALKVTAEIDIYTNGRYVLHVIEAKEPSQQ